MKQMLGPEAVARIPDDTKAQHLDSELLAYMIETVAAADSRASPSARRWLADIVAAIRAWWSTTAVNARLAKYGKGIELTPQDIAALAVRAVKWQGRQPGTKESQAAAKPAPADRTLSTSTASLRRWFGESKVVTPDGEAEFVAFEPGQTKSAMGSNGRFDGANPDIRYSEPFDDGDGWQNDQIYTAKFKEFYGDWENTGDGKPAETETPFNGRNRGLDEDAAAGRVPDAGGDDTVDPVQRRGDMDANSPRPIRAGRITFPGTSGPVGEDKRPVRFYHGTKDDVGFFDTDHPNRLDNGWLGRGFYVSSSSIVGDMHARIVKRKGDAFPNVMPVFVVVRNPFLATQRTKRILKTYTRKQIEEFTQDLINEGYDGAVMEIEEGHVELVAFDARQVGFIGSVKSAIGNNGNFDRDKKEFNFSRKAAAASFPKATPESLRAALKQLIDGLGALPNRLGRVVVATASEIKSHWEPLIGPVGMESESAGRAQGFFDPESNTVFLIADHIQAGHELAVVAHELMHKHGQAVLGQAGWDRLHSVISTWANAQAGSMERRVYDEAAARVRDSGPELSSQELFPYAVQVALELGVRPNAFARQGTVAKWLANVKLVLRQAWDKVSNKPETFRTQDLVNLAFGIAQMENPALAFGQAEKPEGRAQHAASKDQAAEKMGTLANGHQSQALPWQVQAGDRQNSKGHLFKARVAAIRAQKVAGQDAGRMLAVDGGFVVRKHESAARGHAPPGHQDWEPIIGDVGLISAAEPPKPVMQYTDTSYQY